MFLPKLCAGKGISLFPFMITSLDVNNLNFARIYLFGCEVVDEVKVIPRGTFAGTIYELALANSDKVVACNTGEQGGGQN
jgi:hypothetical protein